MALFWQWYTCHMLNALQSPMPIQASGTELTQWTFKKNLSEKNDFFFRELLCDYQNLHFNYLALCSIISKQAQSNKNNRRLIQTVMQALAHAELLEILYRDYLQIPHEVYFLLKDQACYRDFLIKNNVTFPGQPKQEINQPLFFSRSIRSFTADYNLLRLTLTRSRRLAILINSISNPSGHTKTILHQLDQFANPILLNVAWVFFVPRLLNNLTMLAKHLIPGPWLKEPEKNIPFVERAKLQLGRRWFELGNDIAWFTVGLINCFFLTGAASITLALVLQGFDILWAGLLKAKEIQRLQKNRTLYENRLDASDVSTEEKQAIAKHIKYLDKLITVEEKKLNLRLVNASVMFISITLSLPVFAFNPIIPLIGACLAIFASGMVYSTSQKIAKQAPKKEIAALASFGIFSKQPKDDGNEDTPKNSIPDKLPSSPYSEPGRRIRDTSS